MPPKDDDDPASTKEVVTKKQKQLLNREELNLAAIAEAFGGLLLEAPAKKGSGSDLPFKEPEPDPVSKKDAKKLQRMTRASGPASERIQRGLESQEKLSRTRKTRSSAQPPSEKYPKSDPRKAVINYATEVETMGVAGGRRTPEQVGLSADEVAKRTRSVRDTFAAADRGDKKALDKVKEYQRGYDAKYGGDEGRTGPRKTRERTLRTGRTVRTRSSADPGLRDMQGRKGQAPLDPELQKAASRRASQVPDEPTVGKPTVKKGEAARARARGQAQAQGAGRAGRGSSGRTGRQILRSLIGKEANIERIKAEIDAKEKRQAERRKAGQVKRQQTLRKNQARKDTATRITAQDTPKVRRTPKVGGPAGGYRAPAQPTPGNVARQAQVPKGEMTRIRAKTTPSAQPRGASGGDAGATVRRAVQARTTDAGAKARRALQARTPQPVPKPSIPRRVGGTLVRGAVGTGIGLGVGAAIEKLPTDRQTKDRLQTATGVGAAALTPVASTLLSIGGSTRRGETTKPSASDTATAYKSDPNKVSVRSAKPAYDPRNPYDITKWRLSNDPGVTTKMTKTELDKLTKPKFPDLRGSVVPGSVVPKGFVSTDPELAAQTERERQLSTGTQPKTEPATVKAPPVVKAPPKTADPKDPKKPPVKTSPINIPVPGPTVGARPTPGPGGKKTKTGGGRFKFGVPQQPRGKIGRRQNPQ